MSVGSVSWPRSWTARPLWSLFDRVKDVGHPDEEMLSVYRDHGVVRKDSREDNFNKTALNRDIYQLIDRGWLVANRMKAWQGSVGISPFRGIVSGHYLCFRPHHDEESRYLNHLLRSGVYRDEMARLSRGVRPNQIEIDNDWLRVLPVWLPSPDEQRRIADYLDAETARTDALIDTKQQMIALADERLRSMREAELWQQTGERVALCRLVDPNRPIMYGIVLPGPDVDGRDTVAIVKGGDVAQSFKRRLSRTTLEIESRYRRARLRSGDIVLTIRGGIGDVAVVPGEVDGANITQDVARIGPAACVDPGWLYHVMSSPSFRGAVEAIRTGATITGINIGDIKRLKVPPPPRNQQQVVARVEAVKRQTDDLTDTLTRQIALLRERRQALITAAVTGEMEVL